MKKKWIVTGIIFLLLAIIVIGAGRIVMTVHKEVTVNASFYDVSMQLNDLKNYPAWYPGVDSAGLQRMVKPTSVSLSDGGSLSLKMINPSAVILTTKEKNREETLTITAIPQQDPKKTRVVWEANQGFYAWAGSLFGGHEQIETALDNLKSTMEDLSKRYGFTISLQAVKDSVILTAKTATSSDTARSRLLQMLYVRLQGYKQRNLPSVKNNYYYVTSSRTGTGKVEFAVGEPVDKVAAVPADEAEVTMNETPISTSYLSLPAHGHLLTGKATIGQLAGLTDAMNRYVHDQDLKRVAQPMEKYTVEPALIGQSGDQPVELIIPVY